MIERKALVSPEDREKFIKSGNIFSRLLWKKLNMFFNNDSYLLRIVQPRITKKEEIEVLVNQISTIIIENKEKVLSGTRIHREKPIPWSFGKMNNFEKDDFGNRKGIAIHIDVPTPDYFDPQIVSETIKNINKELERLLLKTSKKFKGSEDALKMLFIERHIDIFFNRHT